MAVFGVPNESKVIIFSLTKNILVQPKLYIGVKYINIRTTINDFQSHVFILCQTETYFNLIRINFSLTLNNSATQKNDFSRTVIILSWNEINFSWFQINYRST